MEGGFAGRQSGEARLLAARRNSATSPYRPAPNRNQGTGWARLPVAPRRPAPDRGGKSGLSFEHLHSLVMGRSGEKLVVSDLRSALVNSSRPGTCAVDTFASPQTPARSAPIFRLS